MWSYVTLTWLILALPAGAQQPVLHGFVTDIQGAALAKVSVVIQNIANHDVAKVQTDAGGNFTVQLQPGKYKVTCKAKYFSNYSKVVEVEKGTVEIHIALQLAAKAIARGCRCPAPDFDVFSTDGVLVCSVPQRPC